MNKEVCKDEMGFLHPHKVGLISGESHGLALRYYRDINVIIGNRVGMMSNTSLGSGPLLVDSQEFGKIGTLTKDERWDDVAEIMQKSVDFFAANGAEAVALPDVALHRVVPLLNLSGLSLIHMGEAVAKRIKESGAQKVGFFGSQSVLQNDPITSYIQKANIKVVMPCAYYQSSIDWEIFGKGYLKNDYANHQDVLFGILVEMYKSERIRGVILGNTRLAEIITDEMKHQFCTGYSQMGYLGEIVQREFSVHSFYDVFKIHIDAITDYCLYGE